MNNYGERLKGLRVDRKLTRREVCNALGVTETTLLNWESGKSTPNALQVIRLADYYAMTPGDLMTAVWA